MQAQAREPASVRRGGSCGGGARARCKAVQLQAKTKAAHGMQPQPSSRCAQPVRSPPSRLFKSVAVQGLQAGGSTRWAALTVFVSDAEQKLGDRGVGKTGQRWDAVG